MAVNKWWRPAGVTSNYSDDDGGGGANSNWEDAAVAGNKTTKPGATDTPYFDTADDCTVDEATAALGGWNMTSYTGTLTVGNAVDIDGDAIFAGAITKSGSGSVDVSGSVTKLAGLSWVYTLGLTLSGSGNITTNGASGIPVTVNASGTYVQIDAGLWYAVELVAGTYNGGGFGTTVAGTHASFTISGGSYIDGGGALTVGGDLTASAIGTFTATGRFKMTVSGNISWPHSSKQIPELEIDTGVTATPTGAVYVKYRILGAGAIGTSAHWVRIYSEAANDFWTLEGTCGSPLAFFFKANISTGGAITMVGSKNITFWNFTAGSLEITADGNITGVGTLEILGNVDGVYGLLTMGAHNLEAATVTLGRTAKGDGRIDFGSGSHTIGSLARAAADVVGVVDFSTSPTTLTGTLNGTGLTFANTSGRLAGGGTLINVDCSLTETLYAIGCVDDSGNQNVIFHAGGGGASAAAVASRRHLGGR